MEKTTCLHQAHIDLGAKMSPFAGFDMPIEYAGIETEHNAVRNHAGVFDVSHMGEVRIYGKDAAAFVNLLFTNDVNALADGEIAYGMLTNEQGGTVDDLLVYRFDTNDFLLVINAANIDKDERWIIAAMEACDLEDISVDMLSDVTSELALQGPKAEEILSEIFPDIDLAGLKFYTFTTAELKAADQDGEPLNFDILISRTGYTGEDGFEIYGEDIFIEWLWAELLRRGAEPCGLGCRDTLRFEAGLPLYGDELDEDITPIEAGLGMFVKLDKGSFIGSDVLARQKAEGVSRKVVGLEINSPAIARHGYEVLSADGSEVVGHITTGYRSITLGKRLAMALVDARYAAAGTGLQVRIRRKTVPATVVRKRFYTPNYKK